MTEQFVKTLTENLDKEALAPVPSGLEETTTAKAADIFVKDWADIKLGIQTLKQVVKNPIIEEILNLSILIGDKVDERLIAEDTANASTTATAAVATDQNNAEAGK